MQNYLTKLKIHNLKITPRRKAIIQLFLTNEIILAPEEVWNLLKKQFKKCGLPGVYRNLESLVQCGILAKIQKFDRKRYYGLCSAKKEHHHHIICIQCGKVDDISECDFQAQEIIKGYKLISHYIQLNGICEACLNK